MVLVRGDADRGALLLILASRGVTTKVMERRSSLGGKLVWNLLKQYESASYEEVAQLIDQKKRFDRDLWAIEVDVADVEQFIVDSLGET